MQRILSDLSEDVELMSSDAMLSVKVEHLERMLSYIHELRAEGVVL
ncbi:hypothetical protein HUG15_05570 [Salicibibacter cibarius]|uniref:Uncharacterized protein n=1 Tax=Salicibibacter cibarius TaxID=2743000 RepID=A0A7T7CAP3_9BACI|nr:hypothetical protein [Salicibibacter cibarius]QQK75063.1 hypothetical protein HUG15_05235 [Salicibibacter cibarius]QQK75125.1 hypothetical protein HUG15_05570 [Salicibibacter cibarius]